MTKAVHAYVSGSVQMVGYRQTCRSVARSLHLVGWKCLWQPLFYFGGIYIGSGIAVDLSPGKHKMIKRLDGSDFSGDG